MITNVYRENFQAMKVISILHSLSLTFQKLIKPNQQ